MTQVKAIGHPRAQTPEWDAPRSRNCQFPTSDWPEPFLLSPKGQIAKNMPLLTSVPPPPPKLEFAPKFGDGKRDSARITTPACYCLCPPA